MYQTRSHNRASAIFFFILFRNCTYLLFVLWLGFRLNTGNLDKSRFACSRIHLQVYRVNQLFQWPHSVVKYGCSLCVEPRAHHPEIPSSNHLPDLSNNGQFLPVDDINELEHWPEELYIWVEICLRALF